MGHTLRAIPRTSACTYGVKAQIAPKGTGSVPGRAVAPTPAGLANALPTTVSERICHAVNAVGVRSPAIAALTGIVAESSPLGAIITIPTRITNARSADVNSVCNTVVPALGVVWSRAA